ncbi:unnamed protein product [Blepharisma stoltei]|uniref:CID domain-containing protein n=1 Tax=Blepharisma stoltei TaxID=1481888 RepID=A0AAU9IAF3_9CILI|nr:unnamed protein product [Blepharisma stoltei]
MEEARIQFTNSTRSISTSKDKIFEISDIMLAHQESSANFLTSLWFQEFIQQKDDKKKLAYLFVMNDILIKSSKDDRGNQYLLEFSSILEDAIRHLVDTESENLLEELRKIVLLWERPGTCIFVPEFISQIKESIQAGIFTVQDKKTGVELIQLFEVTKKLAAVECLSEANLKEADKIDSIVGHHHHKKNSKWSKDEIRHLLMGFQEKCENELIDRSNLLMELSQLLEEQYKIYNTTRF